MAGQFLLKGKIKLMADPIDSWLSFTSGDLEKLQYEYKCTTSNDAGISLYERKSYLEKFYRWCIRTEIVDGTLLVEYTSQYAPDFEKLISTANTFGCHFTAKYEGQIGTGIWGAAYYNGKEFRHEALRGLSYGDDCVWYQGRQYNDEQEILNALVVMWKLQLD